jgi:microcystin-dependent protein
MGVSQLMDADIIKDHLHWDPQNQSIYADVPIGFSGELKMWPMSTPPAGWLICDGSVYSKALYPRLWALLGDTWGTSTATQFYVPNLKGKVPVGRDSGQTEFAAVAQLGGDKNLQSHTHTQTSGASLNASPGSNTGLAYNHFGSLFVSNMSTQSAGTGASGNLQPYAVVQYIIKA